MPESQAKGSSAHLKDKMIGRWPKRHPIAILDSYIKTAPDPQAALDIFQGEWTSRLPEPLAQCQTGTIDLFDDGRIKWLASEIGGVTGKSVLELGPLEGGHTYMLAQLGAAEITAVEANTRAFLKCLIVKELLNLQHTRFLCGNCIEYLRQAGPSFEVGVASGVLYHMQNPVELIALLAQRCTRHVFLWTHYYDRAIISASKIHAPRFNYSQPAEYSGFRHTVYRQEYQKALGWGGFCGGSASISNWLSRDDLVRCLQYFGFTDLRFNFDAPNHPNGPALAIIATRR